MSKKSHSEYLLEQQPELRDLCAYYESLDMAEPVLWALDDETPGKPLSGFAAVVRQMLGS